MNAEISDFTIKVKVFAFLVFSIRSSRNYAKIIPNLFDSLEK